MRKLVASAMLAIGAIPAVGRAQAPPPSAIGVSSLQRNAWYLPTSDGAAKLFVTEIGRGSPVVFLHGGPGNDFQYILDALEPHMKKHRFILFDQRGSLLSPVAPDRRASLTLANMVDDLEQLRSALGQRKLTIFGHSFGSLLALAYYQAHPDHVERLVLTGAFPPTSTMSSLLERMRPRQKALRERPEVLATLSREGLAGSAGQFSAMQISRRKTITGLAALNVIDLRRWRAAVGGGVYYDQAVDDAVGATLPERFDFSSTLTSSPIPIRVLQGDRDYIDPGASMWLDLAKRYPRLPIRVSVIPHASHSAWIDDPVGFAKGLASALE